jgi:SulP family sulfate permease
VQHLNVGMTALAPHAATTAFGLLALLGLWLGRRYASAALRHLGLSPRMAQMLVRTVPMWVVILSCVTVAVLATHSTQTLEGVGLAGKIDLSTGFGFEAVWHAPLGLWRDLLLPAALIGLVAYVESLAVAESLAQKRGEKIVPRRELLGLGAANVVAGFSGAMPVTGGFSRSIVNFDAGARTRMAGVWTALFLAVAVLLVGQWLGLLPKAVLAATILIAVLSLLDFHPFQLAWKYARTELYLMMSVAAVTVIWGVEPALLLGVCCSVALLLKATARPHWAEVGRLSDTDVFRNVLRFEVQTQPHVMSIRIDESLVFTNTRWLIEMLNIKTAQNPALRHVVLMMTGVNQIDLTGLEGLMQLSTELKTRDVQLHFSELKGPVADKLQDANLPEWITGEVFRMQADAWRKLEQPP